MFNVNVPPRATSSETGETLPPLPLTEAVTVFVSGSGSGPGSSFIFLLQLQQSPDQPSALPAADSRMLLCNHLHRIQLCCLRLQLQV